jgi:serine/threonine protein kinase
VQDSPFDITLDIIRCPKCGLRLDAGVPICPNDGTRVLVTPEVGQLFQNKYMFVDRLAAGGMGVVYKAKQPELERFVAVKMLLLANATPTSIRRFQIEAQALANLDHPNLVRVYEMGVTDYGQPYTVMEFVDGKGLDEVIAERGGLSIDKALHIFLQVLDGLAYVHDYGILHRDLKPSNIMLVNPYDEQPKVKLVDFGIAKVMDSTSMKTLTQTGEVFGSPLYMSPEQAKGTVVDQRSDIYALGCVFYEALAGTPPFWGTSLVEIILKQVGESAKPLNSVMHGQKVPNSLEAIVTKMLEKDPNGRYQSVAELRKELSAVAGQHRSWYHIAVPQTFEKSSMKPAVAWTLGIAGVLLLTGISCMIAFYALGEKREVQNYKPFEMDSRTLYQIEDETKKSYAKQQKESKAGADPGMDDKALTEKEEELNIPTDAETNSAKIKIMMSREPNVSLEGETCPVETLSWVRQRKAHYIEEIEADEQKVAVTDATLPQIQDLPLLRLRVNFTGLTDKSIPILVKMHNLMSLEISGMKLTAADCRELKQLKKLNMLNAQDCGLTNEGFEALCEIKNLSQLSISGNKAITDEGLGKLPLLPLIRLDLNSTAVDDRAAAMLANLPDVQDLGLSNTHITDKSWPYFEKMKSLRALDLGNTEVTDEALSNVKMPALLKLRLDGCKKITAEGTHNFAVLNPGCQILFGQWSDELKGKHLFGKRQH